GPRGIVSVAVSAAALPGRSLRVTRGRSLALTSATFQLGPVLFPRRLPDFLWVIPSRHKGHSMLSAIRAAILLALTIGAAAPFARDPMPPRLLSGLHWRNIGPYRAGRLAAIPG